MRTMWLLILTTLTLALLGGCDTGKDDGDGPKSPHSDGKTDQIGQCQLDQDLVCRNSDGTFAKSDCCRVSCVVVDVDDALNAHLWEEGLGSIYDVTDDGRLGPDADSVTATISFVPQVEVTLGQAHFERSDGADYQLQSVDDGGVSYRRIRIGWEGDTYEIRLFSGSNIAIVYYEGEITSERTKYAVLDCRGYGSPSYPF